MPTYTSLAVFLLSVISLVIASGFSLGAGMLVLGATVLLRPASPRLRLAAPDYLFIAALGFYFLLHVALNLIHHAPGREYDAPLRFLLAIPALLLLCTFPPRPGALWSGAAVGAIGAGLLSLWQWLAWGMDRPGGSTNPIQYGNISALLAVLSAYGLARALALGHGLQDAQKTMGVMFLAVTTAGYYSADDESLPLWIVIAAASAISLGTYSGGWRIMRTLGRRIIHLDPARGFSAESVGAAVLYTTAFAYHAPISTTHVITSSIMGAGATNRFSAVRWGVARSIVTAWVLTFPAAGVAAAICYFVVHLFIGA